MEVSATNFLDKYQIDGHCIQYSDFIEVAQGGPEVATISIDGKAVGAASEHFGGPPFFYKGRMFVPKLKRSLLGRYFKICVIDLTDMKSTEIGDTEELVLIRKVDDTSIHYFQDLANTKSKSIRWR